MGAACDWETVMNDPVRQARLAKEMEQPFIPDYDAHNMPSADKRAGLRVGAYRVPIGPHRRQVD